MEYRRLGSTGLQVSALCLGTMSYGSSAWRPWVLDKRESLPFYRQAWEMGINFFDTADMYSLGQSEELLGHAMKHLAPRDDWVVATKVYHPMGPGPNDRGLSRKHVLRSIDRSLQRLGTDFVDLYQIHRWDNETPIEETMEALHDIVRAGKARYLGASSMYAWQFAKAQHVAALNGGTPFVSMQNHYNLLYREEEREMIPCCCDQGVGILPWSPLARGRLAKARGGEATARSASDELATSLYRQDQDTPVLDALAQLSQQRAIPPAQLALAWLLQRPGVVAPIVGATKAQHLQDAAQALELKLSPEEIAHLEEPYQPHTVLGHA